MSVQHSIIPKNSILSPTLLDNVGCKISLVFDAMSPLVSLLKHWHKWGWFPQRNTKLPFPFSDTSLFIVLQVSLGGGTTQVVILSPKLFKSVFVVCIRTPPSWIKFCTFGVIICYEPIACVNFRQFAWKYGLWLKFPVITIVTPTQCIRINIFVSWYPNTLKCDVTVRAFLMNFLCIPMQIRLPTADL